MHNSLNSVHHNQALPGQVNMEALSGQLIAVAAERLGQNHIVYIATPPDNPGEHFGDILSVYAAEHKDAPIEYMISHEGISGHVSLLPDRTPSWVNLNAASPEDRRRPLDQRRIGYYLRELQEGRIFDPKKEITIRSKIYPRNSMLGIGARLLKRYVE